MATIRSILHLYPLESAAQRAFALVNGNGIKNQASLRINYPGEVHLYRYATTVADLARLQGYAFDLIDFCGSFTPEIRHRVLLLRRSNAS